MTALAAPGSARAASPLVFSSSDLQALGLRPAPAGAASARRQVSAGLARGVTGMVARATAEAAAGRNRHQELHADALVLRSAPAAARVLTAWRRAHRGQRFELGSGGSEAVTASRRRAIARVLWRDGSRVGLVVLTMFGHRAGAGADQSAAAYARLAQSHLATSVPATAWAKVLAQVRPNGTVSEHTALQAVALAYGPVPGVTTPRGPTGQIPDGTMAAEWVLRYRSRLGHRQLKKVDRLLGLPAPGAGAHAATNTLLGDPGFKPNAHLDVVADDWVSVFDAKLHITLPLTIVAGYTTTVETNPYTGKPSGGDASPFEASGAYGSGLPHYCRIRVFPAGAGAHVSSILAHEVFHCFEFYFLGSSAWYHAPAAWIMEGLAVWGQLSVDPTRPNPFTFLMNSYINSPHTPLFMRNYDGVGFWGHVQDTFGDLWDRIPSIIEQTGGNVGAFDRSNGDTTPFLGTWGSSPFQAAQAAWRTVSPIAPDAQAVLTGILPTAGFSYVEAAPYTTSQYLLRTSASRPVVHVAIDGIARLSATYNYTNLQNAWFCTSSAARCVCPPGTISSLPPTLPLTPTAGLGVTGDPSRGTHGTVTESPISAYCKSKKGPGGGNGGSYGEPRMFDFDDSVYSFQAAGEFTLLKSTRTRLLIQARQQPIRGSHAVSENTAMAMRVGSATVEVDSVRAGLRLYIDKRVFHGSSARLRGGGRLRRGAVDDLPAVMVRWPDGTRATLFNGGTVGVFPAVDLDITLARDQFAHVTGLLGNWGVPASDEFVGANGRHFPQTMTYDSPSNYKIRYGEFGNSWRIRQSQSLFRYPRGKSTRSYTIRNFPREYVTDATLPGWKLGHARAVCQAAGVSNGPFFDSCVLDVAVTGRRSFAVGDRRFQRVAGVSATSPSPAAKLTPIDLGPVTSDLSQPVLAYDPASRDTYVAWPDGSGGSIDVCVVSPTAADCNGGGGPYRLTDQLANSGGAGPQYSDPQVVVAPGGQVVVVAEVDGANSAAYPAGYPAEGVVAWSSPAGGAAFASATQGIADGGEVLAPSPGDAPSGGAIALDPAGDIGVFGDGALGNGFTDFNLATPAPAAAPVVDSTGQYGDALGITGEQVASVPTPGAPGAYTVVAVGGSFNSGCAGSTASAVGFGAGAGTAAQLQSQGAWSSSYFAPVVCDAEDPVLAGGGPAGGTIGLLDAEGPLLSPADTGFEGIDFRAFNAATRSFGPSVLVSAETSKTLTGAADLDLAQDSTGGDYASWRDSRGTVLDYSSTGGAPGARRPWPHCRSFPTRTSWWPAPGAERGAGLHRRQRQRHGRVPRGGPELLSTAGPPRPIAVAVVARAAGMRIQGALTHRAGRRASAPVGARASEEGHAAGETSGSDAGPGARARCGAAAAP